jgi:hypothetical protein
MRRQRRATRRAPLACLSIARSANVALDGDGDGFPAADAQRGDATLQVPCFQQPRNRGPAANPGGARTGERGGGRKPPWHSFFPWTDMSEGLVPMIRALLQRTHCGTGRVLIHSRTDGATALGTQRRKFIASGTA